MKTRHITPPMQEAWDAVRLHGTQSAAALALGINQGTLRGRVIQYQQIKGIRGKIEGHPTRGRVGVNYFPPPPDPRIDDVLARLERIEAMQAGLFRAIATLSAKPVAVPPRDSRRFADGRLRQ